VFSWNACHIFPVVFIFQFTNCQFFHAHVLLSNEPK
jgi:hypothetical protein